MIAALLAAGAGSRFRSAEHKLLALLDGRPVCDQALDHVLDAGFDTSSSSPGRSHSTWIRRIERVLERPSTIRMGRGPGDLAAVRARRPPRDVGAAAVTVGLADQPFVTAEAWRRIADAPTIGRIVVATYDGVPGPNPVRLDRSRVAAAARRRRRGRRGLLRRHLRVVQRSTVPRLSRRHRHPGGSAAMEKLLNEFTVHRSIDDAWAVLTDVERIAPCMPGAQLQEIEGDIYRGVVKVKLGPISTAFKGQAHFVEHDDANHRAVLKGEGRDTGGKGNADALITAQLESHRRRRTKCVVETDLHVTGKVAQFGRGIMGDVSEKLMAQFATQPQHHARQPSRTHPPRPTARRRGRRRQLPTAGDGARRGDRRRSGATGRRRRTSRPCARSTARPPSPSSSPASPARRVLKRLLPALGGLVLLLLVAAPPAQVPLTVPLDDRRHAGHRAARPRAAERRSRSSSATPTANRSCCATPVPRRRHAHAHALLARRRREITGWSAGSRRPAACAAPRREIDPRAEVADAHRRYAAERDAAIPADHAGPRPSGWRGRHPHRA